MPIRMSGMVSGLDTESLVQELVSAYSTKKDKYVKAQTKLSWKQDAWKTLNSKVKTFYSNLSNLRFSSAYNLKNASVSDSTKAKVTVSGNAVNGVQSLQITSLAKGTSITSAKLKKTDGGKLTADSTLEDLGYDGEEGQIRIKSGEEEKTITLSKDTKLSDVVSQLKEACVSASFDATNQRFFVSAKKTGTENSFSLEGTDADGNGTEILKKLGLERDDTKTDAANQPSIVNAQDATIYLNGAEFTSSSNTFKINGLSITATGITGDSYDPSEVSAITVTTSTDTQGVYDKVKDFLTQYNEIINEMTKQYNADSAKGYDPLTEDEKSQMSDKEVEAWEEKIKASLLRRDSNLNTIMSTMQSAMSSSRLYKGTDGNFYKDTNLPDGVSVDKSYSFSSFGIQTLGILKSDKNEQNAYHIYGDEDDSAVSSETDRLMKAINEDPDAVVEFMKNATSNLYKTLNDQMTISNSLRSFNSIYNDKEMATEYSNYTSTIKKWEQKVSDMEEAYYKKFSAMESALSKLQNQTSSLTSMLS